MSSVSPYQDLIACLHCDNLCKYQHLSPGQKAICPNCGSVLLYRKVNSIERTLAIALAGLLFFIPAITMPLVGISVAGQYSDASLLACISILIDDGFPVSATLLFMFTLIVPFIKLSAAGYLSISLKYNKVTPNLLMFFRSYKVLDNWAMLHVFFLGVVVSLYKLLSLAQVSIGIGLVSFALLLLCTTLISVTMDEHFIWQTMEDKLVR
ncbi:paraquat-inducible protein A [Thalassotalea marina]|uniref:Paraquat-inducible protein A n=1 Tax=Thalassotalea marina TaxID=1673741 RepID=A0A919BI69_9GAMM|nr:paraquat-inducible protein A [Thalassotalea marina]GHF89555.1 hypothetical protein GCM10017161_16760 [Thalassotalea marina]